MSEMNNEDAIWEITGTTESVDNWEHPSYSDFLTPQEIFKHGVTQELRKLKVHHESCRVSWRLNHF